MLISTETTAQAVFQTAELTPGCERAVRGVFDGYLLARAKLAIQISCDRFLQPETSAGDAMAISAVIATHLEVLREMCTNAGDMAAGKAPAYVGQFRACAKGLAGSTAMFVAAIKTFVASGTDESRRVVHTFALPVLAGIDAIDAFTRAIPAFTGKPPRTTREVAEYVKPIQAAALSTVSAATLMLTSLKAFLENRADTQAEQDMRRYCDTVLDALDQLAAAVKTLRDANLMHEVDAK